MNQEERLAAEEAALVEAEEARQEAEELAAKLLQTTSLVQGLRDFDGTHIYRRYRSGFFKNCHPPNGPCAAKINEEAFCEALKPKSSKITVFFPEGFDHGESQGFFCLQSPVGWPVFG